MTRLALALFAALPLTAGLVACDPTTPNGPMEPIGDPHGPYPECPATDGLAQVLDARVEGDTLIASVAHSGCSPAEIVTPCWDGLWMESFPVQVDVDLSIGDEQACLAYFEFETELDLIPFREAYEAAYGTSSGSMILNLDGASVLYEF